MTFVAFKGATAYEVQIGRVWVMICHLRGRYWRHKPWRRVSLGIEKEEN